MTEPLTDILDKFESITGHRFDNKALLDEALTHPSVEIAERGRARYGYQRLEFLGDRVLGLIIADMVEEAFPEEPEGALAKRHTALVRAEALAEIARRKGMGPHIRMSLGEEAGGGRDNQAILCDICEAVIGALYRDGGLNAARDFIEPNWRPMLDRVDGPPQDAKSALQEWAQGRGFPLPEYRVVDRTGPAHQPEFIIEVTVESDPPLKAQGTAGSKRSAEKVAATRLLAVISSDYD